MVKLESIFTAYYECRKNKRGTESAIQFEQNFEVNCINLWNEINSRTYKPTSSIAFIVTKPRRREIFAANFRDRVIHHYIDLAIRPILEDKFIEKTCNNRVGKGTSACVEYLRKDIIEASESYTKDCWVCKMDMQGFFMAINKPLLIGMVNELIENEYFADDKEDVKWLTSVVLNDHPERDCILKSPIKSWSKLDRNKSLFWINDDLGLPIGNLISQLLANFYLNEFDHYVSETLAFSRYGRYVDDFYIVDINKENICNAIPLIRKKLAEIGITLHPKKFYLQHYSKGVEFVGKVAKPGRVYTYSRTIYNAIKAIEKYNAVDKKAKVVEEFAGIINSYFGFIGTSNSYKVRKNMLTHIHPDFYEFLYFDDSLKKATVKSQYKHREIVKSIINKHKNPKYGNPKIN